MILINVFMDLDKKLEKYFKVTEKALGKVKINEKVKINIKESAEDFLDMAERYFEDAKHFDEKGDKVNAFAAVCYAHAFLDAGARLGLFDVKDSRLFMVD